ncbi:MAG TPA: LLM class flavin-dependent oxidoreductase [Pseudonocardia sp.]
MVVEIGMTTTGVDDITGRASRLEELGYDYLSVGEHISFNLPTSSPLIALSAAAVVTSRIKLMTSILLAPVYPAALLAKMGSTLDNVSNGRFNLGVGVGGENPAEIEACGVRMSQRGRRADEVLDIVRRLWTEDAVDHEGRYATLHGITIDPKPIQRPHPPIWVSGRKDAAIRRAARIGDGWLPYMFSPEMISASLDRLKELCSEYGRDQSSIRSGAVVFVSCHRDPAIARERALERLNGQYNQDFSPILDRYVAHGDPERVRSRVREFLDAGVESLFIGPACPEEHTAEMEHLLAEELLPALR